MKCLLLHAFCYTSAAAAPVPGVVIQRSVQRTSTLLLTCRRCLWSVGHDGHDSLALEQVFPHAWGCLGSWHHLCSSLGCWPRLCSCCCHANGQLVRRVVNGYEVLLLAIALALLKTSLLVNCACNQQIHAEINCIWTSTCLDFCMCIC